MRLFEHQIFLSGYIRDDFNVLDLGCGKGGDLLKWDEAGIDNLVNLENLNDIQFEPLSVTESKKTYMAKISSFLSLFYISFDKIEILQPCMFAN